MSKSSKKLRDNGFTKKVSSILESVWKFIVSFRKIFIVWIVLTIFVAVGLSLGLDKKAITFLAIVFGLISQAFIGLINIIALVPIVGPLIAKVLALPFYWILNALGYFVSVIAIKRGYSKEVVNYRILIRNKAGSG
ncbi:MAG: hypothetical protein P8048_14870 [Calditrichia bacterium]